MFLLRNKKNNFLNMHSCRGTWLNMINSSHYFCIQTTSDLLSEIASDYLNNEDDLSGAGRKIEWKDNLVVEFNNKASQVNPAFGMLVLAHLL